MSPSFSSRHWDSYNQVIYLFIFKQNPDLWFDMLLEALSVCSVGYIVFFSTRQTSEGGATLLQSNFSSTTSTNTAGVRTWAGSTRATTSCRFHTSCSDGRLWVEIPPDWLSSLSSGSLWTLRRRFGTRSVTIQTAETSGPRVRCESCDSR